MRIHRPLSSLLLAALFVAGAGLPGFSPLAQPVAEPLSLFAVMELEAVNGGHFVTQASINNRPIEVLMDTGATAVALSQQDAQSIGLKPRNLTYDVRVSTANGEGKAARVMLREVEIGSVRVHNVEGLVLQEGTLSGTLLGMSFLSRLRSFTVEDGKLILKN
jgi:aspartyl protease family protein